MSREGVIPERAFGSESAAARASVEESGTSPRRRRGRRQGLDGIGAENDYFTDRARRRSGDRDQARPGAGAGARWRGRGGRVGAVGAGHHVHARGHGRRPPAARTTPSGGPRPVGAAPRAAAGPVGGIASRAGATARKTTTDITLNLRRVTLCISGRARPPAGAARRVLRASQPQGLVRGSSSTNTPRALMFPPRFADVARTTQEKNRGRPALVFIKTLSEIVPGDVSTPGGRPGIKRRRSGRPQRLRRRRRRRRTSASASRKMGLGG